MPKRSQKPSDICISATPLEPAAQETAVRRPRRRIDVALLRAMTDAMPMQPESAGDFVRRMRDEDRY
jgi:hypothetical protein